MIEKVNRLKLSPHWKRVYLQKKKQNQDRCGSFKKFVEILKDVLVVQVTAIGLLASERWGVCDRWILRGADADGVALIANELSKTSETDKK